MIELHRELRPPLGERAQGVDVPEHGRKRYHGANHLGVAARLHTADMPAPGVEVADHVAQVVLGRHDLDLHHGLQQRRRRTPQGLAEGRSCGNLERERAGIDVVRRAVDQPRLEVDDREAGDDAGLPRLLDALLDRRDVILGHGAAHDLALEREARAGLHGSSTTLTRAN